jgi:peptidoglycan/xylan/chitin deacetylase (PgdA/CDA1 family)
VPGKFILSLDCEGKWGVSDILAARHQRDLSTGRLFWAYREILRVLEEFELPSTFAFVGAFTQSPRDFASIRPRIEAMGKAAQDYLAPALRDIDVGGPGWHGHDLLASVLESRVTHEIALHGVTHVPWTSMSEADAEAEMALFHDLKGPIRDSRTFVYPRNLVAHVGVLARHGFMGFRTARAERSRAASFLSEFNLLEAPQKPELLGDIVHIPSGFFLNWRNGLRRVVPPAVTSVRAKRLLRAAAGSGGVVHYWLHPENIASAPSTLDLLRALAREVARSREAGDCEVVTQLGYCRWAESLR